MAMKPEDLPISFTSPTPRKALLASTWGLHLCLFTQKPQITPKLKCLRCPVAQWLR